MVGYYVLCFAYVLVIVIPVYLILPDDIKVLATGFTTFVSSVIIVPLFLNRNNQKKQAQFEMFKSNLEIYKQISEICLYSVSETSNISDNSDLAKKISAKLQTVMEDNYAEMAVAFDDKILWDINTLLVEINPDTECRSAGNIECYAKKCLNSIRRESGFLDNIVINKQYLKHVTKEDLKEVQNLDSRN